MKRISILSLMGIMGGKDPVMSPNIIWYDTPVCGFRAC